MLIKLIPITISFFMFTVNLFSQSYSFTIKNGTFLDDYNYEFDVVIQSNEESFDLVCYQGTIVHTLENNPTIEFTYLNGSSELNNLPVVSVGTLINSNDDRLLTFAARPGNDVIGTDEKKIGRFRITSSQPLNTNTRAFIFWNFEGDAKTIVVGSGFNNLTATGKFSPVIGKYFSVQKSEVSEIEDEGVIKEYELLQNFPNPFNPSTTIKYKIPFDSSVKLKVYNLLGEEVKTLVDDFLSPGEYEVSFDAGSLASGYYVYSLYVNDRIHSNKKMILLK